MRLSNVHGESDQPSVPSYQGDFVHRRWNLWGYLDARDVAQAIRLGVACLLTGARSIVNAAADT